MFKVWCDGFVCAGEYRESSPLSDGEQRGSQLSHSMASTNQQILRELARDLMQVGVLTVLARAELPKPPAWGEHW